MAADPVADRTLDCTGLLCPVPIVKLSKAIKEIEPGQTILLLATDPGSRPDMAAWQRRTKNDVTVMEPEGKTFRFFIRRSA
jgi:tRNA 2-thiouridine synthesizing protein A